MLQIQLKKIPLLVLLLVALILNATGVPSTASAAQSQPDFGPNVIIFDPGMPVSDIQATVDAIHAQQVDDEMGTNRYAFLFKPGVYGTAAEPLQMKVGYYTEVAGLGASPLDVTINGKIEVYNRCLEKGGHEQLPCPGQFLAHLVQPDAKYQCRRPGRLPRLCKFLGGLPGRVDAPSQHNWRQPLTH
jgi:hypothetical protein